MAPNTRGRSYGLSGEEVAALRREQAVAEMAGMSWYDRGPAAGPDEGGPSHWRGQVYRPGSGRHANRGGQWREHYSELARQGLLPNQGKGKGLPNQGKGKDKGKDKGKSKQAKGKDKGKGFGKSKGKGKGGKDKSQGKGDS